MKTVCPKCRQQYELEPSREGQIFTCIECGTHFDVDFSTPQNSVPVGRPAGREGIQVLVWVASIIAAVAIVLSGGLFLASWKKEAKTPPVNPSSAPLAAFHNARKAIIDGDSVELMKTLAKMNVNQQDEAGETLLFTAVRKKNKEFIQILLTEKVNPNLPNKKDEVVLHEAVRGNDFPSFQFLMENGAKIDAGGYSADSILGMAAENGFPDIVSYIVQKVELIPFEMEGRDNPLFRALKKEHMDCARILLKRYNINESAPNGDTFLIRAVKMNNAAFVRFALENNADVNAKDANGESPFFIAIRENRQNLISLLETQDIDWNQQNSKGTYLPMLCVQMGNVALLKKCMNNENRNVTDKKGRGLLYYACLSKNKDVFNYIYRQNANVKSDKFESSPLHAAISVGNEYAVQELLKSPQDWNGVDENGNNALMLAAQNGNATIFNLIFAYDFPLKKKNKNGKTALNLAYENGHSDIAALLYAKMKKILLADLKTALDSLLASKQNPTDSLKKLDTLAKEFQGLPEAKTALDDAKENLQQRARKQSTDAIANAIKRVEKSKSNSEAIKILDLAILENPLARNLEEAKKLREYRRRKEKEELARLVRTREKRERINRMTQREIKEEVTAFINRWMKDMRLSNSTSNYWAYPSLEATLFDLKSWEILGASRTWSTQINTVLVQAESSTKGGFPIRRTWKVVVSRNNDLDWKILSMDQN